MFKFDIRPTNEELLRVSLRVVWTPPVVGILTNFKSLFVLINNKHYYVFILQSFDLGISFVVPDPKHLELVEIIENATNVV